MRILACMLGLSKVVNTKFVLKVLVWPQMIKWGRKWYSHTLKAVIVHEHTYYVLYGVVVRKDNYGIVKVMLLLYVYSVGSSLLKAAGNNIFSPSCWNVCMTVIKYDLKDPAMVLLSRVRHMWLVTSCVIKDKIPRRESNTI